MSWTAINDEFYEQHGEAYVLMAWNGVKSGGGQSCSFVSGKKETLGRWQTCSLFPDDAIRFADREAAEDYLASENAKRPHPLHGGWLAIRISDIETHTGYRPNCKSALIGGRPAGRDHEAAHAPAP